MRLSEGIPAARSACIDCSLGLSRLPGTRAATPTVCGSREVRPRSEPHRHFCPMRPAVAGRAGNPARARRASKKLKYIRNTQEHKGGAPIVGHTAFQHLGVLVWVRRGLGGFRLRDSPRLSEACLAFIFFCLKDCEHVGNPGSRRVSVCRGASEVRGFRGLDVSSLAAFGNSGGFRGVEAVRLVCGVVTRPSFFGASVRLGLFGSPEQARARARIDLDVLAQTYWHEHTCCDGPSVSVGRLSFARRDGAWAIAGKAHAHICPFAPFPPPG